MTHHQNYNILDVVGNLLVNCENVIGVNGKPLLSIYKGNPPIVQISIPLSKDVNQMTDIVADNISKTERVEVRVHDRNRIVVTTSKKTILLEVIEHGQERAEIRKIDLRPLGVEVYGDSTGLRAGNMTITGNKFNNVTFMINLGR